MSVNCKTAFSSNYDFWPIYVQLEIYISVFKEIFANHYFSQGTEFVLIDKQGKIVYAPSYWDSTISTTITYIYDSNVASYSGLSSIYDYTEIVGNTNSKEVTKAQSDLVSK